MTDDLPPFVGVIVMIVIGLLLLAAAYAVRKPVGLFTPKAYAETTIRIIQGPIGLLAQVLLVVFGSLFIFWAIVHALRLAILAAT